MKASATLLREEIQTSLRARPGSNWEAAFYREKPEPEQIRSAAGSVPRGAMTEIAGPPSSGRTALLCSLFKAATEGQEFCAMIDVDNRFDPATADNAGVRLSQILWVRCGGNVEHALKVADMLVQAGGFGVVAIDIGDTPEAVLRRLPMAVWFRLRHAVENTRTALVVVGAQPQAHSSSALKICTNRDRTRWQGRQPRVTVGRLFGGFAASARSERKHRMQTGNNTSQLTFVR